MPIPRHGAEKFAEQISGICDELISWPEANRGGLVGAAKKAWYLVNRYPFAVIADYCKAGEREIRRHLGSRPDVVVFDFPHSKVLLPGQIPVPSVLFTHNVETEIFDRHRKLADSWVMREIWSRQHRKMKKFESETLAQFNAVIGVSDRDCDYFREEWGIENCAPIPTGVDTDFFSYQDPIDSRQIVFCGSMDWMANIDAVDYFFEQVWPHVVRKRPDARMKVVGRSPPAQLVKRITDRSTAWEFTGFVDDVRDHVCGAGVFVIPLRVGSGTRIKAFEAMAMGCPVVSTTIGVEGLDLVDGKHYVRADEPQKMAAQIAELLGSKDRRITMAGAARELVASRFGYRRAAAVFEEICLATAGSQQTETKAETNPRN